MTPERPYPAMATDLYEFTMAQAYFDHEMFQPATFSLFIRDYPPDRGYFVSAGLEAALDFLESIRFSSDDIHFLASTDMFSRQFLAYLSAFRFKGEVVAVPEGELFFKDEPVLEVTAPIIDGQLVETALINIINLQTSLATKVSRCVHAARGRDVVDFSLRRTHGADAGLAVARAGAIVGLAATSNVLAGKIHGIPITGTMAHSFVTSFEDEMASFRAFADIFEDDTVLLIDTYDTLKGAEKAVVVAKEMAERGRQLRGVRLDSGDMVELSQQVRRLFRREGVERIGIFASGGFDEFKIHNSLRDGAQIDAFAVGTKMGVSADAPYTDIAFKLVQYDGRPVMKLSSGKRTLVAPKQVFRNQVNGLFAGDTIALREEHCDGDPLLKPVMKDGARIDAADSLETIKKRFKRSFARLPEAVQSIFSPAAYPVSISDRLEKLQQRVKRRVIEKELGDG